MILNQLLARMPAHHLHDDWKSDICDTISALNQTLRAGDQSWNAFRVEAWLGRRGVLWARQPLRGLHCPTFHTIPETDHEEYDFMTQSQEN
jgi:hypothetical protein